MTPPGRDELRLHFSLLAQQWDEVLYPSDVGNRFRNATAKSSR